MKKEILYVILTPPPNPKSAGITYLNNLGGYLRSIGKKAINIFHIETSQNMFIWDSNEVPNHNHWIQPWQGSWVPWSEAAIARAFSDFSLILIHGENKHYKFFQSMNVVRYYLARIGQLQKKGVPREGEYKLAWDAMYCENPDSILRKSTFRGDLSVAEALPVENRNFDLTYIGKGHLWYPSTPRLGHTIELTRTWPANDDEYFYLLSKTRFLFTYDHITSVVDDAVIFGAYPIFLRGELRNDEKWLAAINKNLQDCYSFIGDSTDNYIDKFRSARIQFINNSKISEARYFIELNNVCLRIENFFNLD